MSDANCICETKPEDERLLNIDPRCPAHGDKPDAKTLLENLQELEAASSPAPWHAQVDEDNDQEGSVWCGAYEDERPAICSSESKEWPMAAADAELIAALRNDAIPALAASQARVEALEGAILVLSEPFAHDQPAYWWQPYNDEQLSPRQADALNKAIAMVRGAVPPVGWTSFEAEYAALDASRGSR